MFLPLTQLELEEESLPKSLKTGAMVGWEEFLLAFRESTRSTFWIHHWNPAAHLVEPANPFRNGV